MTSAINFSPSDRSGGLDRFIVIMIAFSRLSLGASGILHNLHDGGLFRDNEDLPTCGPTHGTVRIQEGKKLEFGGDGHTKPFTVTYGEVISHEPPLAGRSTTVLHAKSPRWKGVDLVVKISWPGSSERVPENVFLNEAIKKAKSTGDNERVLKHLPGFCSLKTWFSTRTQLTRRLRDCSTTPSLLVKNTSHWGQEVMY